MVCVTSWWNIFGISAKIGNNPNIQKGEIMKVSKLSLQFERNS